MNHDLVAEEVGGTRPPVRDQGLARGEFQLQLVTQEPADVFLDFLGFPLGASEAQQPIVRLCRVPGYADCRGDSMTDLGSGFENFSITDGLCPRWLVSLSA
ncbi:hypothetical protein [Streptomyces malaysiensis]|uniref:hypothetical protein n=1 Tax=Streptomyces malaysiensis TaxID=92644 RepID=UPI001AD8E1BD|nr:hypothetical protein [Streptomyces malaysiensis]